MTNFDFLHDSDFPLLPYAVGRHAPGSDPEVIALFDTEEHASMFIGALDATDHPAVAAGWYYIDGPADDDDHADEAELEMVRIIGAEAGKIAAHEALNHLLGEYFDMGDE